MKSLLRPLLLLLPLLAAAPAAWSDTAGGAEAVVIPAAGDLHADGAAAARRGLPIMLIFTAEGCSYCRTLKRDFIRPMIYSHQYDNKILFREIELGSGRQIHDFNGRTIAADDLGDRYGIEVTPTVVFVDYRGQQMADKMVGMTTPDYYGGYLDDAIQTADSHTHAEGNVACKEGAAPASC